MDGRGRVLSVNVGRPRVLRDGGDPTGIDKRPVEEAVEVSAPGPRPAGSGLAGDAICDRKHHGGNDQAVYAYACEELDAWAGELGRDLPPGAFGENLTTEGLAVSRSVVGERWSIGADLVLQVCGPRIPCGVFRRFVDERNWVSRFNQRGLPGAYLRVLHPGRVRAGDEVVVSDRPDHGIDVATVMAAMTIRPELMASLTPATALPASVLAAAREAAGG